MSDVRDPATDQPLPRGGVTEVQQALINAIAARRELGIRKYGQPVMTHNGRNPLRDAWEEVIDLAVYLTQMMLEAGEELELPEVPATWKAKDSLDAAMTYSQHAYGPGKDPNKRYAAYHDHKPDEACSPNCRYARPEVP